MRARSVGKKRRKKKRNNRRERAMMRMLKSHQPREHVRLDQPL